MCCDMCSKYENCRKNNRLRNNCCNKCVDYKDCFDMLDTEEFFERPLQDVDYNNYS